jgi:alkylated DNA repair dioxygenase AlkB
MTQVQQLSTTFQEEKHIVLKSFLEDPLLRVAYNYIMMMSKVCKTDKRGLQVLSSERLRYDVFIETLLEEVRPKLEAAIGKKLYSSYAYARIYKHGNVLTKHKDQNACEVAISLTLGSDGSTNWPIYLNAPKGVAEIHLNAGDALLYRGIEVEHWRESFPGEHQVQLFMFYVE